MKIINTGLAAALGLLFGYLFAICQIIYGVHTKRISKRPGKRGEDGNGQVPQLPAGAHYS